MILHVYLNNIKDTRIFKDEILKAIQKIVHSIVRKRIMQF